MTRFTIICLAALMATVVATTDSVEKCRHSKTDHYYNVGETYRPIGDCKEYTCYAGPVIDINYCPGIVIMDDCTHVEPDLTKAYPDCCGTCV